MSSIDCTDIRGYSVVKLRAASGDPQGTHSSPTQREFTVVNKDRAGRVRPVPAWERAMSTDFEPSGEASLR